VLDPAGYGALNITKAISIQGHGFAGISAASGNAITINAGAGDNINLRGLLIDGVGTGTNGIWFNSGASLDVQDCLVRNFDGSGIASLPSATAALTVSDTVVANIPNVALALQPLGSGSWTAAFTRVQAIGSGSGFAFNGANATGTLNVTVENSTAANNQYGISAQSTAGKAVTRVMVVNSTAANNATTGVYVNGATSTMFLARTTIAGNTAAFTVASSGTLASFGDNYIKSNGSDGGAIALVSTK